LVVVAVGVGLSIFLKAIVGEKPVWTLGIRIVLIGVVIAGSALFEPPRDESDTSDGT
jgi:hypothetical protein